MLRITMLMTAVVAIAAVANELDAVRAPVGESQEVKAVPDTSPMQLGNTTVYAVAGDDYVLIAITDVWLADGTYVPKDGRVYRDDVVVEGTIGNVGKTEVVVSGQNAGIVLLLPGAKATAGCAKSCSCAATSDLCYCEPYYDTDRQMDCCNCYRRRNGVGACSCVAADKE